jgi:GTP cyclohydrolase IA
MNSTPPPCVFDHPPPGAQRDSVGIPQHAPFNPAAFEAAVTDLLLACGISADSVHTSKTAKRVRELWEKRLLGGYSIEPNEALGEGFEDARQDMVLVRGIAIHGVCPHHLVPFRGIAHVAYIPGGRLHGFGRIARMVDAIGHRFTYQEWMTRDIAEALITHGKALGAACVIEAEQLCLLLGEDRRGDERVYTQAFAGCLQDDAALRAEFMQALQRPGFGA